MVISLNVMYGTICEIPGCIALLFLSYCIYSFTYLFIFITFCKLS